METKVLGNNLNLVVLGCIIFSASIYFFDLCSNLNIAITILLCSILSILNSIKPNNEQIKTFVTVGASIILLYNIGVFLYNL